MKSKNTIWLTLVILLSITLSACQAAAPAATEAPIPTEQPTAVPPTAEPPTSEPSPTATLEPTATPEPLPTETIEVVLETEAATPETAVNPPVELPAGSAQLKANVDTNCRKYPMRNSNALGYLKAGVSTNVIGKNSSEDWFYIPNPTNPGQTRCWVWSGSVELQADLTSLVVIDNSIND
jgi:hypothetical protein